MIMSSLLKNFLQTCPKALTIYMFGQLGSMTLLGLVIGQTNCGRLTFILLEAIGRAVIAPDVELSRVRDFLKAKLAAKT